MKCNRNSRNTFFVVSDGLASPVPCLPTDCQGVFRMNTVLGHFTNRYPLHHRTVSLVNVLPQIPSIGLKSFVRDFKESFGEHSCIYRCDAALEVKLDWLMFTLRGVDYAHRIRLYAFISEIRLIA